MYSNVKQLRHNGVRFRRDGEAGPGVNGAVQLVYHNGYACLQVLQWGNPNADGKLLPDLYNAVCRNFHGGGMRWEGYQRAHDKAPAYFQDWLITFVSERPPREALGALNDGTARWGKGAA